MEKSWCLAAKDMQFKGFENAEYLTFQPVGFLKCDKHDLDKIAESMMDSSVREINSTLRTMFENPDFHWKTLYNNYENFRQAFHKSQNRCDDRYSNSSENLSAMPIVEHAECKDSVLPQKIRRQVFQHDNHACACCRATKKLEIDHILAVTNGGSNDIGNLQTLCKHCNFLKKDTLEIDFRKHESPLSAPKQELLLCRIARSDDSTNAVMRMVNFFYHCSAVRSVYIGKSMLLGTMKCVIVLHAKNNPSWLHEHSAALLKHLQQHFQDFVDVRKIVVKN